MAMEKSTDRKLSRREFLKEACFIVGGATLGSAALMSGCGGGGENSTTTTAPTTSSPAGTGSADNDPVVTYKVTHQWAVDDVRDRLMRTFCEKVKQRTGNSVQFLYYPNQALFKARETWDALRNGSCDMAVLPLDYASGKVTELSITLLPCMVQSIEQGLSWRNKPIGAEVDKMLLEYGVRHVIWAWCDGAIGGKKNQIKLPADVKDHKLRAAGRKVEFMFEKAGAKINTMPAAEVYAALTTGVLDSALTSSASWVTFHLEEQANFINVPRDNCMWFMEEGLLMSEKRYAKMTENQKRIFNECAKEVQDTWVLENFKRDTQDLIQRFTEKKVDMYYMTKTEWDTWYQFAQETAWKEFENTNARCKELLEMAKAARG
jgi:TRAP-type C4-dicarboxylate transport system substrate-binding protein